MSSDSSPAGVPVTETVSTAPMGGGVAPALVAHRPRLAVVPVAGFGTRLRPLTDTLPKELLPLGRHTALDRIVAELQAAGIEQIVLVVSPAKEALLRSVFAAARPQMSLHFVLQSEMRGLGDAVLRAAPYLDGEPSFLVALGDAVLEEAAPGVVTRRLMDACGDNRTVGLVVQEVPLERVSRYGIVRPTTSAADTPFAFNQIVEKPTPADTPSLYAAAARYVLPSAVLSALARTPADAKGEVQLTPALQALLGQGYAGIATPLQDGEVRHDIGNFDSYFRAFCTFALSDPDYGQNLGQSLGALLARQPHPADTTLPY